MINLKVKLTIATLVLFNVIYFIASSKVNVHNVRLKIKKLDFGNMAQDLSYLNNISGNAGCVLVNKYGEILMARSQDIKKYHIPGGTGDQGEGVVDTARREFFEETGAHVAILSLIEVIESPKFYLFVCKVNEKIDMEYKLPGEIDKIAWIDPTKEEKNNLRFSSEYIQVFLSVKDAMKRNLISNYIYD